jgi:hypothetical protein
VTEDFLRFFVAYHYVFSANGKFENPDPARDRSSGEDARPAENWITFHQRRRDVVGNVQARKEQERGSQARRFAHGPARRISGAVDGKFTQAERQVGRCTTVLKPPRIRPRAPRSDSCRPTAQRCAGRFSARGRRGVVRREVRRRHDLKHLDVLRVPDLGVPDVRRLIEASAGTHRHLPTPSYSNSIRPLRTYANCTLQSWRNSFRRRSNSAC